MVTEPNHRVTPQTSSSKATLPWKKRVLIAVLLCLEIPFGVVFFPLAAVLVLTGILAPLGMMSFTVATMPLSLAMKQRAAWHSRGDLTNPRGGPK